MSSRLVVPLGERKAALTHILATLQELASRQTDTEFYTNGSSGVFTSIQLCKRLIISCDKDEKVIDQIAEMVYDSSYYESMDSLAHCDVGCHGLIIIG